MINNILHIYTRVSTNAQEEKGTSLESQKTLGIKKSKELGFDYKIWNEGGASSNYEDFRNRPTLLKLLHKMESGEVDHLWVYNNDRLSRNEITAQQIRIALQKNEVKLYTKDGVFDLNKPQDKLIKTILDGIAQFDNAMRADRTRMGKLVRVKEGFWQGGPAPFGYTIQDKKLILHSQESLWVKKIFEWYADRKSIDEIKRELEKNGVKTRRGNYIWSHGSLNKLLQNHHHKGSYTYTDGLTEETVTCQCPSIVTKTLWNKCQDNRRRILERKGQAIKTTNFYMLRDLMYCGHCGHAISGRIKKSKYEKFYYCPKKERDWKNNPPKRAEKWVRGRNCSMTRSLNIDATDDLVWETVINIISKAFKGKFAKSDSLVELIERQKSDRNVKGNESKIKKYKRELKGYEKNIADVETEIILRKKDKNIGIQIVKNLERECHRIKEEIEQLEIRKRHNNRFVNIDRWFESLQTDEEKLNAYTPEEKKDYLTKIVDRITVF